MKLTHWVLILIFGSEIWPEVVTVETLTSAEIRFLLDEEASLRQRLESRVQGLRQRARTLRDSQGKADLSARDL